MATKPWWQTGWLDQLIQSGGQGITDQQLETQIGGAPDTWSRPLEQVASAPPVYTNPDVGGVGGAPPPSPATTTTTRRLAAPGRWDIPDYQSLIAGDPTLMGNLARYRASGDLAARQRRDAIRSAITRFGGGPRGWVSDYASDIDEATLGEAQANPNSILRQLALSRSQNRADLRQRQAARGTLSSGAYGAGEGRIQREYTQNESNATENLLNALRGYETGYTGQMQDIYNQEEAARQAAAGRIMDTYRPTWMDPTYEDVTETTGGGGSYPGLPPGGDYGGYTPGAGPGGITNVAPPTYWYNPATGQVEEKPPGWIPPPGSGTWGQ
jgi:hypothetical protein